MLAEYPTNSNPFPVSLSTSREDDPMMEVESVLLPSPPPQVPRESHDIRERPKVSLRAYARGTVVDHLMADPEIEIAASISVLEELQAAADAARYPSSLSPRLRPPPAVLRRMRRSYSGTHRDKERGRKLSALLSLPEVFQSITSAPNLREFSFEELRVELYCVSFLLTGCAPNPVSADAPDCVLPPVYTPFVQQHVYGDMSTRSDVIMSHEDALSCAFTFNVEPPVQIYATAAGPQAYGF